MRIGFIGLGMMGKPMVKNLMKEFGKTNLWNRTKEKAKTLLKQKGAWMKNPFELAKNSDLIFLMLEDKKAVEEVVFGEKGLWKGLRKNSILIDMTTNLPEYSIFLYKKLREKNVHFLDAPVLGTISHAENKELVIIAGGDKKIFNRVKKYFDAMSRKTIYIGKHGSGAYLKLFINILGAVSIAILSEGLIYLEKAKIDRKKAIEILSEITFGSKAMVMKGKNILENNFEPFFKLKLMEKDIRYFIETSKNIDSPVIISSVVSEMYRIGKRKNFSNLDFSAIYKIYKELI